MLKSVPCSVLLSNEEQDTSRILFQFNNHVFDLAHEKRCLNT